MAAEALVNVRSYVEFCAAPGSSLLEKEVAPILAKYKVDVYFGGHHHSYQRVSCLT